MKLFELQERKFGEGAPCFIIAEMGLGHDGSLGAAFAFIDAVSEAGADAVKFQTHVAEAEGTSEETFRVDVFPQDKSRRDYWRRTAFTPGQWRSLKEHADRRRVCFLSSPFSNEAVQMLEEAGVAAWKLASGETNNLPMLRRIMETGLPVLLSTGMSTSGEIDEAVRIVKERGVPLSVFQCTSRYPCPPEHLGLNMIAEYSRKYGVPVGFSDHSGKTASSIAAVALGACAVEVHVTFSRKSFGPDVPASLTLEELGDVVKGIRFIEKALASPVDKDRETDSLHEMRSLFTKSIVAAKDMEKGALVSEESLAFKKPGTGIPAADLEKVIDRKILRSLKKDEQLRWSDLDER